MWTELGAECPRVIAVDLKFVHVPINDVQEHMNGDSILVLSFSFDWDASSDVCSVRSGSRLESEASLIIDSSSQKTCQLIGQRLAARKFC